MIQTHPYFMEKKEWYNFDAKTGTYTLTDKAPPEAHESLKEWLNQEPYDPLFVNKTGDELARNLQAHLDWLNDEKNADMLRDNRHYRKRQYLKEKAERKRLQAEQAQANATQKKSN